MHTYFRLTKQTRKEGFRSRTRAMLDKFIRFLRSTPNGGLFLTAWALCCNIAWLFLAAVYGGIRWSNVDHPTYAIWTKIYLHSCTFIAVHLVSWVLPEWRHGKQAPLRPRLVLLLYVTFRAPLGVAIFHVGSVHVFAASVLLDPIVLIVFLARKFYRMCCTEPNTETETDVEKGSGKDS